MSDNQKYLSVNSKLSLDLKAKLLKSHFKEGQSLIFNAIGTGFVTEPTLDDQGQKVLASTVEYVTNPKQVSSFISKTFVQKVIETWLSNKRSEQAISLFEFLETNIEKNVKEYKIHFPVVSLIIPVEFNLGDAHLGMNCRAFIDKHVKLRDVNDDFSKALVRFGKSINVNTTLISYQVVAEPIRAKEIAFEACSNLMDCLRICSDTTIVPIIPLHFDLERRMSVIETEKLFLELEDGTLTFLGSHIPSPIYLGDEVLAQYRLRGLEQFVEVIELREKSELQKMIAVAIKAYSKALGNDNYAERVASLFSILEALFLDDVGKIKATLARYVPMVCTNDFEERKSLISTLNHLYSVRSDWVHHAKSEFSDFQELGSLQKIVLGVLQTLCKRSKELSSMSQLKDEIDEAMLKSYIN